MKDRREYVSPDEFDATIAQIGGVRKDRGPAEKEVHKCAVCGHDGGDEVAKLAEVVGMQTFRCVDAQACTARLRRLVYQAPHRPLLAAWK